MASSAPMEAILARTLYPQRRAHRLPPHSTSLVGTLSLPFYLVLGSLGMSPTPGFKDRHGTLARPIVIPYSPPSSGPVSLQNQPESCVKANRRPRWHWRWSPSLRVLRLFRPCERAAAVATLAAMFCCRPLPRRAGPEGPGAPGGRHWVLMMRFQYWIQLSEASSS